MKNFIKLDFPSGAVVYVNTLNIAAIIPTSETSTAIYLSGVFQMDKVEGSISNALQIKIPVAEIFSMIEEAQRE